MICVAWIMTREFYVGRGIFPAHHRNVYRTNPQYSDILMSSVPEKGLRQIVYTKIRHRILVDIAIGGLIKVYTVFRDIKSLQ